MEEGEIEVDSIEPIGLPDITPELARASGFLGVIDLLKWRIMVAAADLSGAVSLRAAASQVLKTARSSADAGGSPFMGSPGDSGKRTRRAAKPPAERGAERAGGFVADFFSQIVQ